MFRHFTRSFLSVEKPWILFESALNSRTSRTLRCDFGSEHGNKADEQSKRFILLHDENGKVLGSRSFEAAQELAKKRKMGLEQINSPSNRKEWFRLVFKKDLLDKQAHIKKEVKSITLSVSIAEHDLKTKAKQAVKWLLNGTEVRVGVTGTVQVQREQLENTLAMFQKYLEDAPYKAVKMKGKPGVLQCLFRLSKSEKP